MKFYEAEEAVEKMHPWVVVRINMAFGVSDIFN